MTDSEIPKHRRKRGKKQYAIESRFPRYPFGDQWKTWRKYETAERRDCAFEDLTRKNSISIEYRIAGDD